MFPAQKIPLLQRLLADGFNSMSVEQYIQSIKNDLQKLLNTFCSEYDWHSDYKQLDHSLLNCGMPNYLKKNHYSLIESAVLCEQIGLLIASKEPRLHNTKVSLLDESQRDPIILYIKIETEIACLTQAKQIVIESHVNPLVMSFKVV